MDSVTFTENALKHLSGEERREARFVSYTNGALKGWARLSSDKHIAWSSDGVKTLIGMTADLGKMDQLSSSADP